MLEATIQPTKSLRNNGSQFDCRPERAYPQLLRGSDSTSKINPVVLVRGCTPVDLRVMTAYGNRNPIVAWSINPEGSNLLGYTPKFIATNSTSARMETNARGLYSVSAIVRDGHKEKERHQWYFRLVDVLVPQGINGTMGDLRFNLFSDKGSRPPYSNVVDVQANFEFKAKVILTGSEDHPTQYDYVKVGVLQNLFQNDFEHGNKTLRGIYQRRINGGRLKLYCELVEPLPSASCPHLDADNTEEGREKFYPFTHHGTVEPCTGVVRQISFADDPGITLPLYLKPEGIQRFEWEVNDRFAVANNMYAPSPDYYALCGVEGRLTFICSIAMSTKDAPSNIVVFEKFLFTMNAKSPRFDITAHLQAKTNPPTSKCFTFNLYKSLPTPLDAKDASMETYGPVAIDISEKIYKFNIL